MRLHRGKHSEKWLVNNGILLHNNTLAHQSLFVHNYLAKISVAMLEYPLYSSLDTVDVSLFFPQLKTVF